MNESCTKYIYSCSSPHSCGCSHVAVHLSRLQDDVGVQIVSCIAGFLSILAFTPQAWAIYTSGSPAAKKTELGTYFVFSLALFMWLVYGGLLCDTALIVTNMLQLAIVVEYFLVSSVPRNNCRIVQLPFTRQCPCSARMYSKQPAIRVV